MKWCETEEERKLGLLLIEQQQLVDTDAQNSKY